MFIDNGNENYRIKLPDSIITTASEMLGKATSYTNDVSIYNKVVNDTFTRDVVARLVVDKFFSEYTVDEPVTIVVYGKFSFTISLLQSDAGLIYSVD